MNKEGVWKMNHNYKLTNFRRMQGEAEAQCDVLNKEERGLE